jgi:putative nucleotidyltransferase with HDIG domain
MVRVDNYDIQDVAREIRQDQIITAKVLQLCNSPIMGLKVMVSSIDRALVILGEKKLLQLILSATVETMFPEVIYGYSLCRGGLYQHALGTAIVAMELSSLAGNVNPDIAYTAGLLHDIGKIPLDQYVSLVAPYFYRSVNDGAREIIEVEKETFGISHAETGGILAKKWSLPAELIDVIKYHHRPEDTGRNRELVTIVYFADLIMSRFQVGHELDRLNTDMFAQRLDILGFKPNQFYDMVSRIPPSVFSMADSI